MFNFVEEKTIAVTAGNQTPVAQSVDQS